MIVSGIRIVIVMFELLLIIILTLPSSTDLEMYSNGLVQDCGNSSANAHSFANPLIYSINLLSLPTRGCASTDALFDLLESLCHGNTGSTI